MQKTLQRKRHKFSIQRLKNKVVLFGREALECIKEYPTVKNETPTSIVDIISMVCALGISVVTIICVLSADVRPWP